MCEPFDDDYFMGGKIDEPFRLVVNSDNTGKFYNPTEFWHIVKQIAENMESNRNLGGNTRHHHVLMKRITILSNFANLIEENILDMLSRKAFEIIGKPCRFTGYLESINAVDFENHEIIFNISSMYVDLGFDDDDDEYENDDTVYRY